MSQTHYTYLLMAQEPFCSALMQAGLPFLYYGVRSCHGKPEDDLYMGSSEHVDLARSCGIVFGKEVRGVYGTRREANRAEAATLKNVKYSVDAPGQGVLMGSGGYESAWDMFFNRNVPGEFPPGSYARKKFASIGRLSRFHDANVIVGNPANGKGGTPLGRNLADDHKQSISSGLKEFWSLVAEYSSNKGIRRPNLATLDKGDFKQWKEMKYSNQGASQ